MNVQDFVEAGKDIAGTVSRAISSGDYSNLSNEVNNTVNALTRQIEEQTKRGYERGDGNANPYSSSYKQSFSRNGYTQTYYSPHAQQYQQNMGKVVDPVKAGPPSNIPSQAGRIALAALGAFGAILSLVLGGLNAVLFPLLMGAGISVGGLVASGIFAALFGWMFFANIGTATLSDLASRVSAAIGKREFISFADIANAVGQPIKAVVAKVKKMLRKGWFPTARIDEKETTLMLTDRAYQNYLDAENSFKEREKDEADLPDETRKILSDGKEYIKTIREINDEIPDVEDMSDKLYGLEDVMNRIFEQVRQNPSSASDIRKLMNYYLPTTVKLLNAYVSMYKQPSGGENIEKAKKEIEDSMDTINAAFMKFLDSMFETQYWDVSSDINVMKKMMSQDGIAPEKQT